MRASFSIRHGSYREDVAGEEAQQRLAVPGEVKGCVPERALRADCENRQGKGQTLVASGGPRAGRLREWVSLSLISQSGKSSRAIGHTEPEKPRLRSQDTSTLRTDAAPSEHDPSVDS